LLDRLVTIPVAAARQAAAGLHNLLEALASWDSLELVARAEAWTGLQEQAQAVHPASSVRSMLQTDSALALAGGHVSATIGDEAAHAAELCSG
jgi:hypothetical protein